MGLLVSVLSVNGLDAYNLVDAVFRFWNPYFVGGDLLMLWGLLVWGIHVEETRLRLVFDLFGTVGGSIVLLVAITAGLSVWVAVLFRTLEPQTMPSVWYGINPLRLLPSVVPVMIAGGIAGVATELLTGSLE